MNKQFLEVSPAEIEAHSFAIITKELGDKVLDPTHAPIIKRCIHTSADFDYADNLYFSPGAVEKMLAAMKAGADIVTDTQMAKAGINKKALAGYGGEVHCFIADEDVAKLAMQQGTTRSTAAVKKAASLKKPVLFVVGNAPTALFAIKQGIEEGVLAPVGIIAAPVGFVNVVPAKEEILSQSEVPCIVARGRKGGSNIAACIVNALLYME